MTLPKIELSVLFKFNYLESIYSLPLEIERRDELSERLEPDYS
jgi:hypothetical protein